MLLVVANVGANSIWEIELQDRNRMFCRLCFTEIGDMAEPSHAQQGSGFNKMLRSLGISSIARGGKDVICQKSLVGLAEFCMTMRSAYDSLRAI